MSEPGGAHPEDDLAVYALDALPAEEASALEEHLAGCEACRERLRWLGPAVDQIPAAVEQHAAPPALRERLLAVVDAEAAVPRAATAATERPRRRWLPSFAGFAPRPALAVLAAVLLLVAGVVGYELHDPAGGGEGTRTYTAQTAGGVEASATVEVHGDEGSLTVSGMPTPRDGVYQAWIKDEEGSIHPSSVFVTSGDGTGTVAIPHGLDGAAEVMVTREPPGGSTLPTEDPLMTAQLD